METKIDPQTAFSEFRQLKLDAVRRNEEYFLLRMAMVNKYRWPRDWPRHVPKITRNVCKVITLRYATYLMGKGFAYNLDRPNTLEFRDRAERGEKIIARLFELSKADLQFALGALTGTQLGRTVYKVYKKGPQGFTHACFQHCEPDYFYGVPSGDAVGEFARVYYSYPIDRSSAEAQFGPHPYKTQEEIDRTLRYDDRQERGEDERAVRNRQIPVLETWQNDAYALWVGGVEIANGPNPFAWKATGEGFIPFVVIENARPSGEKQGVGDIADSREVNEYYNYLISKRYHIIDRYLNPTLVWEGAPQNYAELLAATISGAGAIPTRIGSRLSFLVHQGVNPAVGELEFALRQTILENAGMNEVALNGDLHGSINTGPSTDAQYQPVISLIESKRSEWTVGIKLLVAMLLELQEQIGDCKALGEAVINQRIRSQNNSDGDLVVLSGRDIGGLRSISVDWPGVLPKDNLQAAKFEMEKAQAGLQSFYTTLEKLGEQYPDDEIRRIRLENQDPYLRGEKVAEQIRANTPMLKAQGDQALRAQQQQADQAAQQQQLAMQQQEMDSAAAPDDAAMAAQGDLAAKLRLMARSHSARFDDTADEPVIAGGGYR